MPSNSPEPASPSADSQPLRVAECSSCRQLFAVYATDGLVSCPACSATTAVASLEIAELGVAAPVTPAVPEPASEPLAAALPEPPREQEKAPTVTEPHVVAEESIETNRPPTVAEWLMQSEPTSPAAVPPAETLPDPSAPKRSLSESLGWSPDGFPLDGIEETRPDESAAGEPAPAIERASLAEPQRALPPEAPRDSDFRFDFGSSPLAEQPTERSTDFSAKEVTNEEPADAVSLEFSAPSGEYDEEADFTALLAGATAPQPRGWSGPLSAAAGLLLVAVPAAYLVFTWPSEGELADASENRGRRLGAESEVAESPNGTLAVAETPESTLPFGDNFVADPTTPPVEDLPIQDPATQPASFNAPSTDLPPNPFPASGTIETPAYSEADLAEEPREESQESSAVGNRYASLQTDSQPDEFTLPEDDFASIETAAEPASLAPVERTPQPVIGLVNAPLYSAQQLSEAFDQAIPAAKGFAEGTLTDPTQVSSMGQHYARLCYLAQVLTLLDPADRPAGLFTGELEAADVFKQLFREEGPRAESRQIAGPWIGWTGRPHGGVFFTGVPEEMEAAGETIQYRFRLGEISVPVVMAERINVDRFINASAREVGVIGLVVENPRDWIAGYEGDAERVVWARKTLPLRAPREL